MKFPRISKNRLNTSLSIGKNGHNWAHLVTPKHPSFLVNISNAKILKNYLLHSRYMDDQESNHLIGQEHILVDNLKLSLCNVKKRPFILRIRLMSRLGDNENFAELAELIWNKKCYTL